jgi:uncharacterized protein (TIGR02145 family)
MKKNQNFSICLLMLIGVFLVFASSCEKDDDKGVPVLSTADVTEIKQLTAQSGGIITSDGGLVISARGVCWSTSDNPTIEDNKTSNGAGAGSFTSELTGLTLGTTYYVRAYATNSKGTSYGSTMVFQTMGNTFSDSRDGNIYKIVTIGEQLWMAENLKYLPSVVSPTLGSQFTPYYYIYGYNGTSVADARATTNYQTYGVLYNWEASKAACPVGWHLPGDAEWKQLATYLGGESVAGGKLKETGTTHWQSPNYGATNETGFTALPGGWRSTDGNGQFDFMSIYGVWWCTTEYDTDFAWSWYTDYNNSLLNGYVADMKLGLSVRCVKD